MRDEKSSRGCCGVQLPYRSSLIASISTMCRRSAHPAVADCAGNCPTKNVHPACAVCQAFMKHTAPPVQRKKRYVSKRYLLRAPVHGDGRLARRTDRRVTRVDPARRIARTTPTEHSQQNNARKQGRMNNPPKHRVMRRMRRLSLQTHHASPSKQSPPAAHRPAPPTASTPPRRVPRLVATHAGSGRVMAA